MRQDETQGMSIAALVWSIITLLICMSGTSTVIVDATLFHDFGGTSSQTERLNLVGLFVAGSVLPLTAMLMAQVGKSRTERFGTLGRGLGDAAQIIALIAMLLLGVGAVVTLAIITAD